MPRGLITEHVRSRKLANGAVVFDAGDSVNGHSMNNTSQDKTLLVWNTDVGNQTLEVPKRLTADGDAFVQDILTLLPNSLYAFDYFENEYYGWDDADNSLTNQNAVIVNVSAATVELAVLPSGSRSTIIA
jgi:hypothetical protein